MKRQVLFIQGGGEGAHRADAKLVASLVKELGSDYEVHFPPMPHEDTPEYATWNRAIVEHLARIGDNAILVGHSVGASVIIRSLAENLAKQKLAGVYLLAMPFIGERGWKIDGFLAHKNIGAKVSNVPIYLYHGRADEVVPFAHVDLYAEAIPQAVVRRLAGRNHQLNDDLSEVARDIRADESSRAPRGSRS